jgi:hypothetical protein
VTFGTGKEAETLYLTGTGPASTNIKDAITCTIGDKGNLKSSITCGDNLGYYFNEFHPLEKQLRARTPEQAMAKEKEQGFMGKGFAESNKNWSIGPDNAIIWSTSQPGKPVHFSKMSVNEKDVYAEICSSFGHLDGPMFIQGVAKAYFD